MGRNTGRFTVSSLGQANAHAMIQRRVAAADVALKFAIIDLRDRHSRYLKNGGTLEKAAVMANYASIRMTQFYDCRRDEVTLDKVEMITILGLFLCLFG